ncbi:MAG TPA: hypothetical protein PLW44_07040 [Chitinophagales bacterium]|nr:hypothetical protein [Chitinophagales bacterium]
MNIFKKLALIGRQKQKPFSGSKHVIKHAFTSGGIDYFEFDTLANLPWRRGLKFLSVYNELDMRCDRFYLTKHVEAVENILTGGKRVGFDELVKINQLNQQLKERLQMVYHEDLVYKVASVVFFDANENPDDWEWKYAMEKIERWKKDESVNDFFLHEPIQRLMPFLNVSDMSLQQYSALQQQIDKAQLENIYTSLSASQRQTFSNAMQRYFTQEMKPN